MWVTALLKLALELYFSHKNKSGKILFGFAYGDLKKQNYVKN